MKSFLPYALLSLTAASLSASTILIDFGASGAAYETAGNWNNVTNNTSKSSHNSTIASLLDDAGDGTGFSLNTFAAAVGANTSGVNSTSSGFPATASRDSFYIEGSESIILTLSNLDPGLSYDFTFYAARSGGTSPERIANYEVIGGNTTDSTSLNAYGNISNTVSLTGFTADGSNEITINMTRTSGSFAYIGVLQIDTAVIPEPSHYALLAGSIGLLAIVRMRRKRTVA